MSRPPTPLAKITPGSAAHNKGRIEDRLAKLAFGAVGQLGNPPKWMLPEEKKIWKQIKKSAPCVLGENDRCLMEITVVLKAKLETRTNTNSELSTLIQCLTKLGLIAVDRAPAEKPKESDPLDRFNILS